MRIDTTLAFVEGKAGVEAMQNRPLVVACKCMRVSWNKYKKSVKTIKTLGNKLKKSFKMIKKTSSRPDHLKPSYTQRLQIPLTWSFSPDRTQLCHPNQIGPDHDFI
jgi:hypothetical protein